MARKLEDLEERIHEYRGLRRWLLLPTAMRHAPREYRVGLLWGIVGTFFVCCAGFHGMEYLVPDPVTRLTVTMVGILGMVGTVFAAEILRRRGWHWDTLGLQTGFLLVALLYMIPVGANVALLVGVDDADSKTPHGGEHP